MNRLITTPRLTMRPPEKRDFEDIVAVWGDPDVARFVGGKPSTREECWARLARYVGHWALLGFGFWTVHETSSGRYVGEVGLADFKRDITPSLDGAQEMGWVLARWSHGKGFATEAVHAAIAWDEKHFGRGRLVCMIDPGNAPSIRVAEKTGFKEFARTTYKNSDVTLFERPANGR